MSPCDPQVAECRSDCGAGYLAEGVVHPHLQSCLQIFGSGWDDALGAHSHRDMVKQGLGQLLLYRRHICLHLRIHCRGLKAFTA